MSALSEPGITIRKAAAGDAQALAVLLSEMDDEPSGDTDSGSAARILDEMARYPDFSAYLVFDGHGMAIATFSLMIFSSLSHRGSRQALLDAVVVTRQRRGQGIGEAMIKHALHVASGAGCYKLSLSSNLKRVDAHRFYERLGFRQHGVSFSLPLNG